MVSEQEQFRQRNIVLEKLPNTYFILPPNIEIKTGDFIIKNVGKRSFNYEIANSGDEGQRFSDKTIIVRRMYGWTSYRQLRFGEIIPRYGKFRSVYVSEEHFNNVNPIRDELIPSKPNTNLNFIIAVDKDMPVLFEEATPEQGSAKLIKPNYDSYSMEQSW